MAQHTLGFMYFHGEGVPQSYSVAMRWWHKAAEQGYAKVQFTIGTLHHRNKPRVIDSDPVGCAIFTFTQRIACFTIKRRKCIVSAVIHMWLCET